jgi:hypothetical protein
MLYGIVRIVMRASDQLTSSPGVSFRAMVCFLSDENRVYEIFLRLMRDSGVQVMVAEYGVGVGKALLVK